MHDFEYKELRVKAICQGGIETCYILPDYNVAFDVGRCPSRLIDVANIFLTHGHLDHAAGLPYYLGQRTLKRLSTPKIYAPKKLKRNLTKILKYWQKIEGFSYPFEIKPMIVGSEVALRNNVIIRALPSYHRVPSLGYVLLQKTKKLKKEYLKLPGNEIRRLKDEKQDIFVEKENALFSFSGDSTIEFVLNNEEAQKSKVLFMECTYIDDKRNVERARQWGHTHLDEIVQYAHLFQNERLVLVHASRRYSEKFFLKMMDKKLPSELRAKTFLLY